MQKGLVIKSTGSWYTVKTDANEYVDCKLKGRFRTEGIKNTNPVVVGDHVLVDLDYTPGLITSIGPRKNYIIRRSINLSKQSHIIAANIDMAFLVVTFRLPETPLEFIDRFLVSAEAYRIPVCIILNKKDIYTDHEWKQVEMIGKMYQDIGYDAIATSVKEDTGIGGLRQRLQGITSVIAGLSGVGKSSLINMIDPGLKIKTGDLSEYHKSGKHTTTYAEMHELHSGGYVIDTPGIRGFGLIDIEKEELYHFFPEIFKFSAQCAFHNCLHINEPQCAVIDAVSSGKISASRYNSYLSMMEDTYTKYR